MPLFSVIIPCYNAAATLPQTLNSVLAQTLSDWEAIIVDDGSSDDTPAIAKAYGAADSRIRYVRLKNGGPSRARNVGVAEHAYGNFVAFLDSDDIWVADKLARSAEVLTRETPPDAVYGRIAFFQNTPDSAKTVSTIRQSPLTPLDLIHENAVCTMSNLVVSRAKFLSIGGFNPAMTYAEDIEWLVRLASSGARIEGLDQVLVYYRTSPFGLSADLDAMHRGWESAVSTAVRLGLPLAPTTRRRAEAVHLRYLARRALRCKTERLTSLRLAIRAIRLSPLAFFSNPWRGGMTFAAACIAPIMPERLRRLAFAF